MKKWGELPPLHLDEKDLETDLGEGKFIFVGHTIDMFAEAVPKRWIIDVLNRMRLYNKNKYLLQSKNPSHIQDFTGFYSDLDVLLGTTIETNRDIVQSNAPPVLDRSQGLYRLSQLGYSTMVTIEPIFDFDLEPMVELIKTAKPEWVNIGADSKGHKLPEPSTDKVRNLIRELGKLTCVKLKGNLKRIMI